MNEQHNGGSLVLAEKQKGFNRFYLSLVIVCGIICAMAIVIAVFAYVWMGLAVGIIAVVIYRMAIERELRRTFGISYRRVKDGLAVSFVKNGGKNPSPEEVFVPDRIMWLDVAEICEAEKKKAETNIRCLHIPKSVKTVDVKALSAITELQTVYYGGSAEEWSEACRQESLDVEVVFAQSPESTADFVMDEEKNEDEISQK